MTHADQPLAALAATQCRLQRYGRDSFSSNKQKDRSALRGRGRSRSEWALPRKTNDLMASFEQPSNIRFAVSPAVCCRYAVAGLTRIPVYSGTHIADCIGRSAVLRETLELRRRYRHGTRPRLCHENTLPQPDKFRQSPGACKPFGS